MAILHDLARRSRHIAWPVLGACLAGYFVYHAMQGERGIVAMLVLRQQIHNAESLLASTAAEREALEARVKLLRPTSLDPDLLDERARAMLNLAYEDEVIVLHRLGPATEDRIPEPPASD